MHDYHAAEAVVDYLTRAGLSEVGEVRIQAGPAHSPAALRQAYEILTLGTPLAGSLLLVETAEERCTCPACGLTWDVRFDDVMGHVVVCPSCGTPSSADGLAEIRIVELT